MTGELLSEQQVNAVLVLLVSTWPGQSMSDSQKSTWRRQLSRLAQGEFTPAFDAWLGGSKAPYRPDVGEFMALVTARRRPAYFEPDPDEPPADHAGGLRHIRAIRSQLAEKVLA